MENKKRREWRFKGPFVPGPRWRGIWVKVPSMTGYIRYDEIEEAKKAVERYCKIGEARLIF